MFDIDGRFAVHLGDLPTHMRRHIHERLPQFTPRTQLTLLCYGGQFQQGYGEYQILVGGLIREGMHAGWNMVHYDSCSEIVAAYFVAK